MIGGLPLGVAAGPPTAPHRWRRARARPATGPLTRPRARRGAHFARPAQLSRQPRAGGDGTIRTARAGCALLADPVDPVGSYSPPRPHRHRHHPLPAPEPRELAAAAPPTSPPPPVPVLNRVSAPPTAHRDVPHSATSRPLPEDALDG
eukprot:5178335-Prymnesium_polylepis.1